MNPIRQSFSWWCFAKRGVEPADIMREAASIGYHGIDLIEESLWPLARDAGLHIVAVAGHTSLKDGLNRRENAARIEAELRAHIEKAAQWRIPQLICFTGNRPPDSDDAAGLEICAETLARVAPAAEQAGVTLCVELLNSKVEHPGYQADSTAWGVRLCQHVSSPAVRLLYDIYHMQVMEGDLIRTIRDHHAHISHYHTAGNPGRGPTDDSQEINYPAVYRAIAAAGYEGCIGHEFLPQGDPIAALRAAYQQCAQSLGG